ncbi:MAG: patatin-like phospholipase family protein, partial [Bacteroidales bacterium]
MRSRILTILICLSTLAQAQRVGLVLSGGGAKGIAHIGLIKVLEENGIPIDYITGTSMGAIVGALYAMGYSPEEMLTLVKSEDFKLWQSGTIKEEDVLYYLKKDPVPELVQLNIDIKKDSTKRTQAYFLPSSLVNPVQMNLAFLKLFSQASGHAQYDFDNLFVPFRCISSDVYHKNALISRKGDLGQAVRASMTFPFVFSPIEIDGNLMYDGGIYNNFPVDVMKDDFNPDIIIGSSVTSNPSKPSARELMGQMENMIMQKTDYSISEEDGIYIRSHVSQYGLMDFDKADEIYAVGYKMGLQYIDSIKSRVGRRIPKDIINLDRMMYKSELPDFKFKNVHIT